MYKKLITEVEGDVGVVAREDDEDTSTVRPIRDRILDMPLRIMDGQVVISRPPEPEETWDSEVDLPKTARELKRIVQAAGKSIPTSSIHS